MLTQEEADLLLQSLKQLLSNVPISFPMPGEYLLLDAESTTTKDKFILDVNRRGTLNIKKCTYQTRYQKSQILIRVDIEGPAHPNPDGTEIPCPHIHIYREGFDLKWAYPLEDIIATNPDDLAQVLVDFLRYNKIINIPSISYQGGDLV
jgi:hypothetical protein